MKRHGINDIRKGLKVLANGEPCEVIDVDQRTPDRRMASTTFRLRAIRSGRVLEITLRGSDTLESADVQEARMLFCHRDGDLWHFIGPTLADLASADTTAMSDAAQWLKGGEFCVVSLWNDTPLAVLPPDFVELAVTDTDPGLPCDTSGRGGKPARLETDAVVCVPLFVARGDLVRVDTRTGEYAGWVR